MPRCASSPSLLVWILVGLLKGLAFGGEPPELVVPPGYASQIVAGAPQIQFPMFGAFDERGRLFVTESSGLDLGAVALRPGGARSLGRGPSSGLVRRFLPGVGGDGRAREQSSGQGVRIEPGQIESVRRSEVSIMPEGLLDAQADQQLRDLFAIQRPIQPCEEMKISSYHLALQSQSAGELAAHGLDSTSWTSCSTPLGIQTTSTLNAPHARCFTPRGT